MSYPGGYTGGSYGGWAGGGWGGAQQQQSSMYAAWAAQAGYSTGAGGGGGGGYSSPAPPPPPPPGPDLSNKLQAMASYGGAGGGFGSRGGYSAARGGRGRGAPGGPGGGGGPYDMKKFAAYQTNKRKFDDGGGRGRGRGRGRGGGDVKRGRFDKPRGNKPREGREPELNIFIDQKFNIWNLPSKAKVVLVSNLPECICQPDLLYNIFSFYGDVERIRLIRRANSCSLVEFTTATFACLARNNLDGLTVRGSKLLVTFSRYDRIRMPWETGHPESVDTKDFSGTEYDKYKRYRSEELKKNNMRKITEPTSTVHISGIPGGKSPNDVKRLFELEHLNVVDCIGVSIKKKTKEGELENKTSPRMFCYVQFGSVDDGLLGMAHYANSVGMRISFAKDDLDTLKKNCIEKNLPLIMGEQIA